MKRRINIPALFSTVVKDVSDTVGFPVYFDYGHYTEVTRNLTEKGMGKTTKDKKFPLVWLVMDYVERYGNTDEFTELNDIQLLIATITKPGITTPDRISLNFLPTLYPIYDALVNQIGDSYFFEKTGLLDFDHEKIDRPYWDGKDGTGNANLFNDFIDAIQIRRLKLIVNESTCSRFRLIPAA